MWHYSVSFLCISLLFPDEIFGDTFPLVSYELAFNTFIWHFLSFATRKIFTRHLLCSITIKDVQFDPSLLSAGGTVLCRSDSGCRWKWRGNEDSKRGCYLHDTRWSRQSLQPLWGSSVSTVWEHCVFVENHVIWVISRGPGVFNEKRVCVV